MFFDIGIEGHEFVKGDFDCERIHLLKEILHAIHFTCSTKKRPGTDASVHNLKCICA